MKEKEMLLVAKRIRLIDGAKELVQLKVRKRPTSETKPESVQKLAEKIIEEQSFRYKTLAEAKKTVCIEGMVFCFDAFSLCGYSSNLTKATLHTLNSILQDYCEKNYDKERKKQRKERDSLFRFLLSDNCPYRNYTITKSVRPDFILEGEKRIGIEVTELTSSVDQILIRISKDYYGQGMSAEEIKEAATRNYKCAKNYEYKEVCGSPSICTGLIDLNEKRKDYSDRLYRKYCKYRNEIEKFNDFIILADAESSSDLAVSSQEDVEAIFENLRKNAEVKNATFAIMWQENFKTGRKVSYCKL